MDEIRTDEVMVTEVTGTEDAECGFGLKDAGILAAILGAGYGIGKGAEALWGKVLKPKVITPFKEKRAAKKAAKKTEAAPQQEVVAEETKEPKGKKSEVEKSTKG